MNDQRNNALREHDLEVMQKLADQSTSIEVLIVHVENLKKDLESHTTCMQAVVVGLKDSIKGVDEKHGRLKERVTKVERRQYLFIGGATVIGTMVGSLIKILKDSFPG